MADTEDVVIVDSNPAQTTGEGNPEADMDISQTTGEDMDTSQIKADMDACEDKTCKRGSPELDEGSPTQKVCLPRKFTEEEYRQIVRFVYQTAQQNRFAIETHVDSMVKFLNLDCVTWDNFNRLAGTVIDAVMLDCYVSVSLVRSDETRVKAKGYLFFSSKDREADTTFNQNVTEACPNHLRCKWSADLRPTGARTGVGLQSCHAQPR